MSEGGIAICIFSAVVIALAILLVYLGDREDKKEQENEKENGSAAVEGIGGKSAATNGGGDGKRYVRLERGGGEASGAFRGRNDRRNGRKARGANNGVDACDRGAKPRSGQSPTRD